MNYYRDSIAVTLVRLVPPVGRDIESPAWTFIYQKKNNTVVNLVISKSDNIKDDCIQSTSASDG